MQYEAREIRCDSSPVDPYAATIRLEHSLLMRPYVFLRATTGRGNLRKYGEGLGDLDTSACALLIWGLTARPGLRKIISNIMHQNHTVLSQT